MDYVENLSDGELDSVKNTSARVITFVQFDKKGAEEGKEEEAKDTPKQNQSV